MLIASALSADRHLIKNKPEKILKYEDFNTNTAYTECKNSGTNNTSNMGNWNHLNIIQKHLNNTSGKNDIKELQKRARRGTAHLFREVLM
jgi:hypothetical protein